MNGQKMIISVGQFHIWRRIWASAIFVLSLQLVLGVADPAAAARKHLRKKRPTVHRIAPPIRHIATPFIVIDEASGRVIAQRNATHRWFPASVTKLMTVYVALQAVRQGRLTLDTPLVVSARAARMPPSKMGFAPGTEVTLGNALKMLMVKSANDVAVTVAEGVSGSVEAFAAEMNNAAKALGMRDSHFDNPNGLPDPNHFSSARDMAILGRALLLTFPEHANLFSIGAMKLGDRVIPNYNRLIGRYPGANGMKTGYTCASGFNLVASATRNGRQIIAVIMGDASARIRTAHMADLLDRAFADPRLGEPASDLPDIAGAPPDMHPEICNWRGRKAFIRAENEYFSAAMRSTGGAAEKSQPDEGARIAALPRPTFDPVRVFVGPAPGYQGPVAGPRPPNTPIGLIAYAPPVKPKAKAHHPRNHATTARHRSKASRHHYKHKTKYKASARARKSNISKEDHKHSTRSGQFSRNITPEKRQANDGSKATKN